MTSERLILDYAMERYQHLRMVDWVTWRSMIDDRSIIAHCRRYAADAVMLETRLRSGVIGAYLDDSQIRDIVERFLRE